MQLKDSVILFLSKEIMVRSGTDGFKNIDQQRKYLQSRKGKSKDLSLMRR